MLKLVLKCLSSSLFQTESRPLHCSVIKLSSLKLKAAFSFHCLMQKSAEKTQGLSFNYQARDETAFSKAFSMTPLLLRLAEMHRSSFLPLLCEEEINYKMQIGLSVLMCFRIQQDYFIRRIFHCVFISETKKQPTQKEEPGKEKVDKVSVPEY